MAIHCGHNGGLSKKEFAYLQSLLDAQLGEDRESAHSECIVC